MNKIEIETRYYARDAALPAYLCTVSAAGFTNYMTRRTM